MGGQFEVLNPWAEVDPVPLKGISPRLSGLNNKTVGLLANDKPASSIVIGIIREQLTQKFPNVRFSSFLDDLGTLGIYEKELKAKVQEWAQETF